MRLLLGFAAYVLMMLGLMVRPTVSALFPRWPDTVSYAVHAGAACVFLCLYLLYRYDRRARPDLYEGKRSAAAYMAAGAVLALASYGAAPHVRGAVAVRLEARRQAEAVANEEAAAEALGLIAAAQNRFRNGDLDSDGAEDYARDLRELASAGPGLPEGLARALSSPRPEIHRGYVFTAVKVGWSGPLDPAGRFAAQASPAEYGRTGRLTYFLAESGVMWHKDTGGVPLIVEPADPAAAGWFATEAR